MEFKALSFAGILTLHVRVQVVPLPLKAILGRGIKTDAFSLLQWYCSVKRDFWRGNSTEIKENPSILVITAVISPAI